MILKKDKSRGVYRFTLLFCFSAILYYRPFFLDVKILKVIYGLVLVALIFNLYRKSKKGVKKPKSKLNLPVRLIVFSILFSVVPAYEAWEQSIPSTLLVLVPYLTYLLYFYFHKKQISRPLLEKAIFVLGMTSLICYFIAFIAFPTVIFGSHSADEISDDRGFARILIAGLGFIYLLYFLALNNYFTTKNKKWLFISVFCFVGIFMTLTRQVIFSCVLLSFLLMYMRLNLGKRFLAFGLAIAVGAYVIPNLKFVQILVNQTKEQSTSYKDDQRFMAFTYYLNDFAPDEFARIFGNGEASLGNSYYGIYMQNVQTERHLFQSDVGFVGFYAKFGLIGILGWILVFFRVIITKFPPDAIYLKLFILLVLFTGLSSSMPFNENYIPAIAISFYLIDKTALVQQKKRKRLRHIYDDDQEPEIEQKEIS
jgi:hypothetical protein